MKTFPRQRLSFFEKTKNNYAWCKDTIDNLLTQYQIDSSYLRPNSEYERKLSNYQLFNNFINQKDFERECNPLQIDVKQFKDQIQPYNKTYNKIHALLDDEYNRPFNFKVSLTNSEGVRSKLLYKNALLKNYVYSTIERSIGQVTQIFPSLAEEGVPNMSPEEIEAHMGTYLEKREILGSKILEYLRRRLKIKDKKNDAFKHALIAGEEFVYVSHLHNEPILEVLNPLGVFYHKGPETKYVEDGLFAGYRTYMTSSEVLDRYGRYLTQEELKRIDGSFHGMMGSSDGPKKSMDYYHNDYEWQHLYNTPRYEGSYSSSSNDNWLVQHVEWRSQRKVAFLTFTNEYGDTEQKIVPDDFPVPENATKKRIRSDYGKLITLYSWTTLTSSYSLYYDWIPEIWQGTRIGDDIYCMMGPRKYQFRHPDNPFDVKLSYHGLVYNSMNAESVSLMDRMKPFQYLYFVVMHRLKRLIARDVGKIFHMDSSMVDPKLGWEKTLYYLTEMNLDIFNPLENADQPGWSQRGKATSTSDWTNTQHILNYVSLLDALDNQISEVAGVSKSREGQISPGEAVTNAQTNIRMSSVVTGVYFQQHDNFWERVLDSLLNIAHELYRETGVSKQYFLDDFSLATLNISPGELLNASFGVFVVNSAKEAELFESLKGISQALIQSNRAKFSDLIKVFKATSSEELSNYLEHSEARAIEDEQRVAQQANQNAVDIEREKLEFEREKLDKEIDAKIKVAEINSFRFQTDQDLNNNNVPDQLEIDKFRHEKKMDEAKLALEEKKLKQSNNKS